MRCWLKIFEGRTLPQLDLYGEVQHDSYIDGWLRVLKADKKALFRACNKARETTEYLLALLNVRSAE